MKPAVDALAARWEEDAKECDLEQAEAFEKDMIVTAGAKAAEASTLRDCAKELRDVGDGGLWPCVVIVKGALCSTFGWEVSLLPIDGSNFRVDSILLRVDESAWAREDRIWDRLVFGKVVFLPKDDVARAMAERDRKIDMTPAIAERL